MNAEGVELWVSQARDRFSDAVNRAIFGGEIVYVAVAASSEPLRSRSGAGRAGDAGDARDGKLDIAALRSPADGVSAS